MKDSKLNFKSFVFIFCASKVIYRARNKSMQILLSNSQAGSGRTVKQEQEEISRNHVQAFIPGSVVDMTLDEPRINATFIGKFETLN